MITNARSRTWLVTIIVSLGLFASAVLARALTPTLSNQQTAPKVSTVIPSQFAEWRDIPSSAIHIDVTLTPNQTTRDQPYDDLLSRTYGSSDGSRIMLTLAYGSQQRQEVKIHRPELCYPAQGLPVQKLTPVDFGIKSGSGQAITGNRMIASAGSGAVELVSYWIRIGATYSDSPWITRMTIVKEGLAGRMTDGILVRVSQRVAAGSDYDAAFRKQEQFLAALVANTPQAGLDLIAR